MPTAAEPFQLSTTVPPRTSRDIARGYGLLAVLVVVLAPPLYGVWLLSESIRLKPDIERAGGSLDLAILGPDWFRLWAERQNYLWLFGTPVGLTAPSDENVDDAWLIR